MQQNGKSRDVSDGFPGEIASANSKAVGEVVQEIGSQIQISGDLDIAFGFFSRYVARFAFFVCRFLLVFVRFDGIVIGVRMRMTIVAFDESDAFFNNEERDYAQKDAEADGHVVSVDAGFLGIRRMRVRVRMRLGGVVGVRNERVGNQMEKSVAEQATGGETKQDFQERLSLFAVVERNEKEEDERRRRNQESRAHCLENDVLFFFGG